jgi:hypothetical protein
MLLVCSPGSVARTRILEASYVSSDRQIVAGFAAGERHRSRGLGGLSPAASLLHAEMLRREGAAYPSFLGAFIRCSSLLPSRLRLLFYRLFVGRVGHARQCWLGLPICRFAA